MSNKQAKCPECGTWVILQNSISTQCTNCNTEIINQLEHRRKLLQDNHEKNLDQWIFKEQPSDRFPIRFLKKIGNLVYMIMMAIAAFIAWLVAAMPG